MKPSDHLCVALDVTEVKEAERIVRETRDYIGFYKVGMSFFDQVSELVSMIHSYDAKIFLDLKFHDIPNTVANAMKKAAMLGVDIVNLHASGGLQMMQWAKKAADEEAIRLNKTAPKLIAVTVLTSLDKNILSTELKNRMNVENYVIHLAGLTKEAGLAGIVCSGHEAAKVRKVYGKNFLLVVPGIRPQWMTEKSDQRRVLVPKVAIQKKGADILVVGRPIIKADSPKEAARKLYEEIEYL